MANHQGDGIFQQKALERLRSPEQLDKLVSVTNPIGWVALVSVLLLVCSGLFWAFFGVMATKVSGIGVIVDSNGVANITHTAGGRITNIKIAVGDRVHRGQVIAVIEQIGQQVPQVKAELGSVGSKSEITAKMAQLDTLQGKEAADNKVVSAYDGIVVEQKAKPGEVIQAGEQLFSIRLDQGRDDMIAMIYVPVMEGKKVRQGMLVQISPGSVDSSEYGTMVGRVSAVSEYPISADGIDNWLGNKAISSWIVQKCGGAVMEIRANPIKDSANKSGYLWSSIMGAPEGITPGTVCTASIVVDKQPPITKAFHKINQWLRSD